MARSIGIRVFKGDDLIETLAFERDIIKIGRLASAHLRLEDPKVSRIHAVIEVASTGDEVSVIDMGSAEGTRVNGEKVSRTRLKHGDEVSLGDSRLVVLLEGEASTAAGVVVAGATAVGAAPSTELIPGRGLLSFPEPTSPEASGVFAAGPIEASLGTSADSPSAASDEVFVEQSVSAAVAPGASSPPSPAANAHQATPPIARPAPVPSLLPPLPEEHITPENRFVEVSLRWGGTITDVRRVRDVPKLSIGVTPTDDIFVPLEEVGGGSSFELITQAKGSSEWVVRFLRGMSGSVIRGGHARPLSQSGASADGDGLALTLTDDMVVELSVGYFTIEIRNVARSRVIPIIPFFDMFFINTALVTLFSMASVMSVLLLLPVGLFDGDDDLASSMNQFQTIILKPPPKNNEFLNRQAEKASAQAAQKEKGKAGKKEAKKDDSARMAVKSEKPTNEQVVAAKMKALFGDESGGGIAALFGATTGGGELEAALGGISGTRAADAYGEGGLGIRGSAPGGGGTGIGTLGIGRVGTLGRGTGNAGYGSGAGGIGQKTDRDVAVSAGKPIVLGSLDKEIIRRVVRENQAQIKYCYEKELTTTPGLYGKITMKWVITGTGTVSQAKVDQSDMKNKSVEDCIARKITTWRFPKPKGGGIVIVTYPFVFKQTN
jgi:hypothetical protein